MTDDNWVSELMALLSAPSPADQTVAESWVDDVLSFWFEELEPRDWFKKSTETDRKIADRFLRLHSQVRQIPVERLIDTPRQALAAVIVLDQFPRNLFRGDSQSFATDTKALDIARRAVDAGFGRELGNDERVFLYLPFEHSEDLVDQDRAVELITAIGDENYTAYAVAHRDVIKQFGRFPHRNAVLGRTSTVEEECYLAQPGSGF